MQRLIAKAQNLRDRVEQRINNNAAIPTSTASGMSSRTDRDGGHDRVGVDGSGGAVVRIPVEAARRLQVRWCGVVWCGVHIRVYIYMYIYIYR